MNENGNSIDGRFSKIFCQTFIDRTNEFSLSLETGYRWTRLNIKILREISREIYFFMKKKKRGISSSSCSKLNNSFLSCSPSSLKDSHAWIAGEDPARRRESSLGRLNMLESWKKSQLKEWFTRVDAARGFALWFDSWLVSTINRWIISLFLGRRVRRRAEIRIGDERSLKKRRFPWKAPFFFFFAFVTKRFPFLRGRGFSPFPS